MSGKIREALNEILEIASPISTGDDDDPVERIAQIAEAALAEPVRNCEVGTAEEQSKRFKSYCDSKVCKRRVCHSYGYEVLFHHECFAIWSQMPYESEEKGCEKANVSIA